MPICVWHRRRIYVARIKLVALILYLINSIFVAGIHRILYYLELVSEPLMLMRINYIQEAIRSIFRFTVFNKKILIKLLVVKYNFE